MVDEKKADAKEGGNAGEVAEGTRLSWEDEREEEARARDLDKHLQAKGQLVWGGAAVMAGSGMLAWAHRGALLRGVRRAMRLDLAGSLLVFLGLAMASPSVFDIAVAHPRAEGRGRARGSEERRFLFHHLDGQFEADVEFLEDEFSAQDFWFPVRLPHIDA